MSCDAKTMSTSPSSKRHGRVDRYDRPTWKTRAQRMRLGETASRGCVRRAKETASGLLQVGLAAWPERTAANAVSMMLLMIQCAARCRPQESIVGPQRRSAAQTRENARLRRGRGVQGEKSSVHDGARPERLRAIGVLTRMRQWCRGQPWCCRDRRVAAHTAGRRLAVMAIRVAVCEREIGKVGAHRQRHAQLPAMAGKSKRVGWATGHSMDWTTEADKWGLRCTA